MDLVQWQREWIMYGEILLADLRNTKGAISELPQSMTASHESDKHGNVCLGLWRQNYHKTYGFAGYNKKAKTIAQNAGIQLG